MAGHKALFLSAPSPMTAAAMRGWLAAGNEIVGLWIPVMPNKGLVHRDRRLAWIAPQWSTAAVLRRNKIPVRVVPRLANWPERMDAVYSTGADILICHYFPFIVPDDMLTHFGNRAVNLHPSPLPRYRGPTPVEAMILDGSILTEATMAMHLMTNDLDAGDVIAARPLKFPHDGNREKYRIEQAKSAQWLTENALPDYLAGKIAPVPQDHVNASYCKVYQTDLALNDCLNWQAIEWRCRTLARYQPLDIDGIDSAKIVGFSGFLGPASGKPPVLKPFHVDMDSADARVRLKRKRPWTSLTRKAVELLVLFKDRNQA
jgi:hypothetical protein